MIATSDLTLSALLIEQQSRVPVLMLRGWELRAEGGDGIGLLDHAKRGVRVIHSVARELDGQVWAHISVSRRDRRMPSWEETRDVFRDVMGDEALGIIVIPPKTEHVNISEVSHVFCCLTARPLPDFTQGTGSL